MQSNWLLKAGAVVIAAFVVMTLLLQLGDDPGTVAPEAAGRDNSARAIHKRILVLDGWLGTGAMPCGGDTLIAEWAAKNVDSGIWWLRNKRELDAARCWLTNHRGDVQLALLAGDAPRLHTAGKRSIYLGVVDATAKELAGLYSAGVRFAHAPANGEALWMMEARRLGITVDASRMAPTKIRELLAQEGPSLLYSWSGEPRPVLDRKLMWDLGERRGGAILLLPGSQGSGIADVRQCLRYASWPHCAIGGAGDPPALSAGILGAGYTEGNLARMFGFDILRVLRSAEVWSGKD